MKITKVIILVLGLAIILVGGFFTYNAIKNNNTKEPVVEQNIQKGLSLRIDFGNGNFKDFSVDFKENYSAFDLLKEAPEKLAFPVKSKTYDIGVFVESINGIDGGKDNKYWSYYVNGEMPMISSDKNLLKSGDKVEFRFEESKF